ncbi:MAG: helix-turn-helix domain-containing protein [Myxococcaceae bacterium]|nr:helix-turn-helix domain-containing protein [Myxococcaceae bacterium]
MRSEYLAAKPPGKGLSASAADPTSSLACEPLDAKTPTDDIERRVAQRLRELRVSQSLSLRQLALRAGLSAEMASRAERGIKAPSVHTLAKLCRGLGVSLAAFFEFTTTQPLRRDSDYRRLQRALARLNPRTRARTIAGFEALLTALSEQQ